MNILFQEPLMGKKDLPHCLGWMGCWEKGCIQVHSWGRTLGWWRLVGRGWNSVHSAPVVGKTALGLESPFFLASGVERPEYLEGGMTTNMLFNPILKPKCIYTNIERKWKLKICKSNVCLSPKNRASLVFLSPRRRCCSGDTAMVDGAIVYLKYFQKSKRAFRLKREASTSSVNVDRRNFEKHSSDTAFNTKYRLLLLKWWRESVVQPHQCTK